MRGNDEADLDLKNFTAWVNNGWHLNKRSSRRALVMYTPKMKSFLSNRSLMVNSSPAF